MFRVDAEPVSTALFYQVPVRNLADKGMVAGSLRAYHLGAAVILHFHGATVSTVRDLASPDPAACLFIQVGHVLYFLLSVCHRSVTYALFSVIIVPDLERLLPGRAF